MNLYRVSFDLTSTELVDLLDNFQSFVGRMKIKRSPSIIERNLPEDDKAKEALAPIRARAKRGSKVNSTILAALKQNGPLAVGALKTALVDAGLAAGSLSTGLAQLQKDGEVERTDNGLYGLKAA